MVIHPSCHVFCVVDACRTCDGLQLLCADGIEVRSPDTNRRRRPQAEFRVLSIVTLQQGAGRGAYFLSWTTPAFHQIVADRHCYIDTVQLFAG